MACEFCSDIGDGRCVYPYYGLAPHIHDFSKGVSIFDSTVFLDGELPNNFQPDPENKELGTYLYCPKCGAGEKK
jgi:hypothetical protein